MFNFIIYCKIIFWDKVIKKKLNKCGPRALWRNVLKPSKKRLTQKKICNIIKHVNLFYKNVDDICVLKSTVMAKMLSSQHSIKLKLGVKNSLFYDYIKKITNYSGKQIPHFHCWITIDDKTIENPFWEYMWDIIYVYEVA